MKVKAFVRAWIHATVFPKGGNYHSAAYTSFVGWSAATNFFVSAESVLSTHSMLAAVAASTTLALSSNFIGKDILGQIGGIVFMNKYAHTSDQQQHRFIRKIMIIQQGSTFLECATPLVPIGAFLPIAAVANVGKNICWTGFGAVNATVIQKLAAAAAATDGGGGAGVGEIYSKIAVINTIASSLGMTFGLFIAAFVPSHTARLICVMPIIAAFRVWSFKKSLEKVSSS